jgi:AcrR family transcriptional regulator
MYNVTPLSRQLNAEAFCKYAASKYAASKYAAARKTDHEGADPRDRRPIVLSEAGISKRTLYNHFPSKDELISAYLQRRFTHAPASDKPPVEQILGTFDRLERGFAAKGFRGCPFVNAVAELGAEDRSVKKIAIAFKESRRLWFRDLLLQLGVADPEGLATQLTLLVDGSIAQDLVRDDPSMARAAKDAARVLLRNAGIKV